MTYISTLDTIRQLKTKYGNTWATINPENAARMATQNRFKTGLDIAKYTAATMRRDMAAYDADPSIILNLWGVGMDLWHNKK